jgi:peptide-methionine (S)-S-oxide reductase
VQTKRSFSKAALLAALIFAAGCGGGQAVAAVRLPAAAVDSPAAAPKALQKAVLAGGCFWGVQGVFAHVNGVTRVVSGYSGGTAETAHYKLVSGGRTTHAEAVEITFDPSVISYGEILRIFFSVATDPTQLNAQHPDVGPQYRNEIFAVNEGQARIARAYIAQLGRAKVFPKPIVTKVSLLKAFYPAEAYHQNYLFENPTQPYIVKYDLPKLQDLRAVFPERWRAKPVLVRKS